MLPESQARILRLLARYPDELTEAWDVPRELSLPGLSESLGLVRSALHDPLKALEEAIEPYAEQKRELKAEFKEQGWLSGDEISLAVKAYRMLKKDQDIDELVEMFNFLRGEK